MVSFRIFFVFCAMLFSGVLASGALAQGVDERNPAWAQPVYLDGVDNFYKVNDGLYRSAQPTLEGFKNLEALGIKTVINLRDTNKDPKLASGTDLILKQYPITTWSFNDDDLIPVLRALNNSEQPVLVHCRHGADRTGVVMALYRIVYEGWSKEDAKAEMFDGGYGFHSIWSNIVKYLDNLDEAEFRTKVITE